MNIRNLESNLGLFVAVSVLLHIAAAAALYYLAPEERTPERRGPYIVRIAPPEPLPPEPIPPEAEEGKPSAPKPEPSPPEAEKKAPPPKTKKEKVARAPEPKPPAKPPARGGPEAGKEREGKAAPPLEKTGEAPGEGPAPSAPPGEPGEEAPRARKGEAAEGKKRLFDPDVLAGVIEKGRPPKPPDSSITFDAKEIRRYSYMRKLKARIEAVWEYPREAAEQGVYGDLVIKFVIRKDGSLGAVEVVRTSGWQSLDRAALAALRDGNPYWPLPEEWDTEALTVTGHFIYTLSGYYYLR